MRLLTVEGAQRTNCMHDNLEYFLFIVFCNFSICVQAKVGFGSVHVVIHIVHQFSSLVKLVHLV